MVRGSMSFTSRLQHGMQLVQIPLVSCDRFCYALVMQSKHSDRVSQRNGLMVFFTEVPFSTEHGQEA